MLIDAAWMLRHRKQTLHVENERDRRMDDWMDGWMDGLFHSLSFGMQIISESTLWRIVSPFLHTI